MTAPWWRRIGLPWLIHRHPRLYHSNRMGDIIMSDLLQIERWVRGIEYATMAGLLFDFRKYLERRYSAPVYCLELNGALTLNDLCDFLCMDEKQRLRILGREAIIHNQQMLGMQIEQTPTIHPCPPSVFPHHSESDKEQER